MQSQQDIQAQHGQNLINQNLINKNTVGDHLFVKPESDIRSKVLQYLNTQEIFKYMKLNKNAFVQGMGFLSLMALTNPDEIEYMSSVECMSSKEDVDKFRKLFIKLLKEKDIFGLLLKPGKEVFNFLDIIKSSEITSLIMHKLWSKDHENAEKKFTQEEKLETLHKHKFLPVLWDLKKIKKFDVEFLKSLLGVFDNSLDQNQIIDKILSAYNDESTVRHHVKNLFFNTHGLPEALKISPDEVGFDYSLVGNNFFLYAPRGKRAENDSIEDREFWSKLHHVNQFLYDRYGLIGKEYKEKHISNGYIKPFLSSVLQFYMFNIDVSEFIASSLLMNKCRANELKIEARLGEEPNKRIFSPNDEELFFGILSLYNPVKNQAKNLINQLTPEQQKFVETLRQCGQDFDREIIIAHLEQLVKKLGGQLSKIQEKHPMQEFAENFYYNCSAPSSLKLKIKACLEKNGWKVGVEDVKGMLCQGYLEGKVSPPEVKDLIDSYVAANSTHFALFYKLLLPHFYEDLIKNAQIKNLEKNDDGSIVFHAMHAPTISAILEKILPKDAANNSLEEAKMPEGGDIQEEVKLDLMADLKEHRD
jgi:hypothetical protein